MSELSEDKRKVLEHRLINNPHAKNVETVVGFGENSRDKAYVFGPSMSNECSRDRVYMGENSRDKTYTPGAPIACEGSRDKAYKPGQFSATTFVYNMRQNFGTQIVLNMLGTWSK